MTKSRKKPPDELFARVVSVQPRAAPPAAVVPRSKPCPVCRKRPGDTAIDIGPVTVKVCSTCGANVFNGMQLLDVLKRFL